MWMILVIYLDNDWSIFFTKFVQYLHDLCTIFAQCLEIFSQYLYSICMIFAQSIYDIFTLYKQYSHNILYNINTKLFYNIWTIVVQHLPKSCLIFAQYLYNIWTILLQYLYSIFIIKAQYFYNSFTILKQNLHNILYNSCTIVVQYFCNICTIFAQYLYNICTIFK